MVLSLDQYNIANQWTEKAIMSTYVANCQDCLLKTVGAALVILSVCLSSASLYFAIRAINNGTFDNSYKSIYDDINKVRIFINIFLLCTCISVYIYMYIYMCVFMHNLCDVLHVHVYIYTCMWLNVYVHKYVCFIYVGLQCMYLCIFIVCVYFKVILKEHVS